MNQDQYHHGNLREQLIIEGINMLNDNPESFSLRKLAKKCGVSHNAPYSHFKDIYELKNAIKNYVSEKFLNHLMDIPKDESLSIMTRLGAAYITFFQENPNYFHFIFFSSEITVNLDEDLEDDFAPFVYFRKTAHQFFQEKKIPEHLWKNTIISLWGQVHGLAALSATKGIKCRESFENIFIQTI